jgi:undecaprenyl-diphosphatase
LILKNKNMLSALSSFDHSLFHLIHGSMKNVFFDWLMPVLSNDRLWVAPLGFACVLAVYFGRRRGMFVAALLIVTVGLCDFTGNILKHLIVRARPLGGALDSFPSNHAANSFGFAFVVSYFWRNRWARAVVYALAAMVCYSRVYVAAHYPADVLAGACWGSLIGFATVKLSSLYFHGYHDEKPLT